MKKVKKSLIIVLFSVIITAIFASCGNTQSGIDLTLKDYISREDMYINKEYDAKNLVVEEDGVSYYIEELFYLNEAYEKKNIAFNEMKFTQTEPFDVVAILGAKKKKALDTARVEIKVNFNSNEQLDAFANSWCDPGVVKTLTASKQYLSGEAETALSMRYLGSYNPNNDGVNLGGFTEGIEGFSVTNWANAIITADVYNPNTYDLQLGLLITKDGEDYTMNMSHKLVAGEWTKVNWSLRRMEYTENYFSQKGSFSIKSRVIDEKEIAPYDYRLYFCNLDVANYSVEAFPNVETRTDIEINQDKYEKLPGDEIDRKMVCFTEYTPNYTCTTDTAIKKVGESSVKYTFTMDKIKTYPTWNRGTLLKDLNGKLFDSFTSVDWRNAFVGFWVKTPDTRMDLLVRFANTQDGETYSSIGDDTFEFNRYYGNTAVEANPEWQYVEFSLNTLFPRMYTKDVTNMKFCICSEIVSEEGVPVNYYIDGLSIFSKAMVDPMDRDLATLDSNADIVVATNTDKANVKVGESSLKCVFTHNGNRSKLLYDHQSQLFNKFTVTNWNNAYIGFWVKTTDVNLNLVIRFNNSEDGTNYKGDQHYDFDYEGKKNKDVYKNAEWQYVEFSLNTLRPDMYTGNITKFRFALCTEITSNATFYIDDFKLYSK